MNEQAINWLGNACHMTLFGVTIQQKWQDLWLWEKLLNEYEVKTIIEIGTKHGGLSNYLLCQAIQRKLGFATFDIEPYAANRLATHLGLQNNFMLGNVFGNDCAVVRALLKTCAHPVVLLCDGGDKRMEFDRLVPELQPGDIVGVHDWGMEFFEVDVCHAELLAPILWNECEALDSWTRFWMRRELE